MVDVVGKCRWLSCAAACSDKQEHMECFGLAQAFKIDLDDKCNEHLKMCSQHAVLLTYSGNGTPITARSRKTHMYGNGSKTLITDGRHTGEYYVQRCYLKTNSMRNEPMIAMK